MSWLRSEQALQVLALDSTSNLGWRIYLAAGNEWRARDFIREAAEKSVPLYTLISDEERRETEGEAAELVKKQGAIDLASEGTNDVTSIAVTSYGGPKGRSAQYVFLIGVHSGEIPSNATDIKDIEICRFLVGLTRTKKKCDVLVARNAMGNWKQKSEFLDWIKHERFARLTIDAAYFA